MANMNREEFERHFSEVNASLDFENAGLNDREKELLYKKITGQISADEFSKAVMEVGKK